MEYIKYTLSLRGMRCGECESHINNAIRNNFKIKKVKANRYKKEVVIYTMDLLDETKLKNVLDATGYQYLGLIRKETVKKLFLL